MKILLVRHGETAYNARRLYQGSRDIPLSPEGIARLKKADFCPPTVYVTPLQRTHQTAQILFPGAKQVIVPDFQEMHFGDFEGRSAQDMVGDPAYRAWVDSGCTAPVPGGESMAIFCDRVCIAFQELLEQSLAAGETSLVVVAHGGTQMAILERFALPEKGFYDWFAPNGTGTWLDTSPWHTTGKLTYLERVSYAQPT